MNISAMMAGMILAEREGVADQSAALRTGLVAAALSPASGMSVGGLLLARKLAQDTVAEQASAEPPPVFAVSAPEWVEPALRPAAPPVEEEVLTAVPNVSPVRLPEAEKMLQAAGLEFETRFVDGDGKFPLQTVVSQNPYAGARVARGTRVVLEAVGVISEELTVQVAGGGGQAKQGSERKAAAT
jgi:hypothetical protein